MVVDRLSLKKDQRDNVFLASKKWAELKKIIAEEAGTRALADLSRITKSQSVSGYS